MNETSGESVQVVRHYRRRPITVEAMRYDGPSWVPERERFSTEAFRSLSQFTNGRSTTVHVGTVTHGGPNQYAPAVIVQSKPVVVHPGDFIVRDNERGLSVWGSAAFDGAFDVLSGGSR